MCTQGAILRHKEYQEAFQEDCEMFLRRFILHSSYSFNSFAEIWTDLKFGLVFVGKYREYELGHFTHLVLHCAKKYFLIPECKFTQTGGLYLLYSLYNKQPIKNLIKIKLLLNELEIIKTYINKIKEDNALEPQYILDKLINDNAFEYSASQHELILTTKYAPSDLKLVNDIFPCNGTNLLENFQQETNSTLGNLYALDKEMLKKLEAFKRKHPNVFLDNNNKVNEEMYDTLTSYEHLQSLTASDNDQPTGENSEAIEESRATSDRKKEILNRIMKEDSRSKYIKQRVGDEAIPQSSNS